MIKDKCATSSFSLFIGEGLTVTNWTISALCDFVSDTNDITIEDERSSIAEKWTTIAEDS